MRFTYASVVALLASLMLSSLPADAQMRKGSDLVQAELISDTAAVEPGKPFRLAVRMTLEPHWHVYWKHPGETGLPTRIQLNLPDGFTAGEVQYPVPTHFVQPGNITGYGYADEVLFIIDVTPPQNIESSSVSISGKASYLVCDDSLCLPGSNDLQIELPVGTARESEEAGLIGTWAMRVPERSEPSEVSGSLSTGGGEAQFTVTVPLAEPGTDLRVFVEAPDALSLGKTEVSGGDTFATVRFDAKLLTGLKLETSALPLLVAYTDSRGQRKGVAVDVPLRSAEQSQQQ